MAAVRAGRQAEVVWCGKVSFVEVEAGLGKKSSIVGVARLLHDWSPHPSIELS